MARAAGERCPDGAFLEIAIAGEGRYLCVRGELDVSTVAQLEDVVATAGSGRGAAGPLQLDLRGLTFCDAAGIEALLRIKRTAAGEDMVLLGLHGEPRRVMEVTHTVELFDA